MIDRRVGGPVHAGRLIVAVAVVVVVSLVAVVLTSDRAVRPDLGAVPLPEGSVTHAATEDCTDDVPPVCSVHLAVGPAGGVELPADTERMLAEHLRGAGWATADPPVDDRGRVRLVSPDGGMLATVGDHDRARVPRRLESAVDEDVDRERLAHVTVAPRP